MPPSLGAGREYLPRGVLLNLRLPQPAGAAIGRYLLCAPIAFGSLLTGASAVHYTLKPDLVCAPPRPAIPVVLVQTQPISPRAGCCPPPNTPLAQSLKPLSVEKIQEIEAKLTR